MKLIPAPGSKEMQYALEHHYVRKIVDILLQEIDLDFFRVVAMFLQKYDRPSLPGFVEKLQALHGYYQRRPDEEGRFAVPSHIDAFVKTLAAFYEQDQEVIDFQRGAIVELLASGLVCSRCRSDECLGNHRFVDRPSRYESDQVDVAVLSEIRQQIEGYACKIKSTGIMSVDCTNLTALAAKAQTLGYGAHIGVVCFDNSNVIEQRIRKFPLTRSIYAYGLDNFRDLRNSPF